MTSSSSSSGGGPSSSAVPFSTFSQIPGNPSFRNAAVNGVAIIPLLSSGSDGQVKASRSSESFRDLLEALGRHSTTAQNQNAQNDDNNNNSNNSNSNDELVLVIPNSSLTRPGDWKYQDTPLKSFHWQEGCQRLLLFDGLPQNSRAAHDRVMNQTMTRDWIDLCPSRRTAAVVGVLNVHDCQTLQDLHRAEEELHQWATRRYSTPPYEVTAHGRGSSNVANWRDVPVERLYVFDSFDEECQKIDISKSKMGTNSILAFPPSDKAHAQMMDLHLNVVVNDLALAIFRTLEARIRESDEISKGKGEQQQLAASAASTTATSARRSFQRIISGSSDSSVKDSGESSEEPLGQSASNLSIGSIANLVSPNSKLAKDSPTNEGDGKDNKSSSQGGASPNKDAAAAAADSSKSPKINAAKKGGAAATPPKPAPAASVSSMAPQLLTPLDESWDLSQLSAKDVDAIRKRDIGRREKLAADLSLLAGSPLDAYERYLKAAELCKTGTPDPLWYAMALEGCAAAHIAMAEAGGYNVDAYLENNFQMPEEVMALARKNAADDKRQTSTGSANKQTLPEVVFALCEEALNITNRHERLGAFHAELLLKLAWYTSESAEGHLRCRWGEGPGSFSGDPGNPPRWTQTSVSRLRFNDLRTKDDRDMTEINTLNRVKKVCELLQEAVSVGALDGATRVDVAARSARLCLDGIQSSQWKKIVLERVKLPRKAAFFMVTAAEAMSSMAQDLMPPSHVAEDLWLMACQLYSPKPNDLEKENNYGWATLRASTLHALSLRGNSPVSQEAAELLLSLLVEISPKPPGQQIEAKSISKKMASPRKKDTADHETEKSVTRVEPERKEVPPPVDTEEAEGTYTATAIASKLRYSFTTMTAASSLLSVESRWADEEAIRPIMVPLSGSDISTLSLGAIWSTIDFQKCSAEQKQCIDRIVALRKGLHTSSSSRDDTCAIYGTSPQTLPLYVSSAMAINAESFLELDCVKKSNTAKADEGVMATFFNPYANKGKAVKAQPTRVSEDEERVMMFQFGNPLAVPLEISQCRLAFIGDVDGRVEATKMSFIVPPLAKNFTVHFPFTILAGASPTNKIDTVEVKGISLACMGRSFFLPVRPQDTEQSASRQLPDPSSVYPHKSVAKKKDDEEEELNPKIEALPCQPRLQLYLGADTLVDADTTLQLNLTDAEVVETPSFRLGNYCGSSGRGKVERLQISVSGIPGVSEKLVYDSESETDAAVPEDAFIKELLDGDSSPPLKVRLLHGKRLSLDSVNAQETKATSSSDSVAFQIATAHNLGKKIPEGGATISIRFRYSGQSTASLEVWRQREISICISYFKGPCISSLSFRPDLSEDAAYAELCKSLEKRTPLRSHGDREAARETPMTSRVGLDSGVYVCGKRFVAIITVNNEIGDSDIILSRKDGNVGGFDGHPLKTVLVHKGVTAKIPISISRFPRVHEVGTAADLVEALTEKTTLRWDTAPATSTGSPGSGTVDHKAHGLIRIPVDYLQTMLSQNVPRICHPPCTVELTVGGKSVSAAPLTVAPGQPIDLAVKVDVASWVPTQVVEACSLTLEFFSARRGKIASTTTEGKERDHIWCGKLRQSMALTESTKAHTAKVVYIGGSHSISACARLSQGSSDEVWWAPMVATVVVDPTKLPAQ